MITNEQQAILRHTSNTGRYLTGGTSRDFVVCQELAAAGLLRDHGPQRLADGDHYYTTTAKGREALNEWQATQPKPKPLTRSQKRYRHFLSLDFMGSFREYLACKYCK